MCLTVAGPGPMGQWAMGQETPATFGKLHKLIKPQPGESRFQEIPWLLSVWEGRQKAAALGKPMLVWAGGWGVPIGVC
jgi:hypothetical protein